MDRTRKSYKMTVQNELHNKTEYRINVILQLFKESICENVIAQNT